MIHSEYFGSFDGAIIHYRINRKPRNPTLIFIHGVGSNHTVWDRVAENFSDRSFIQIDLRKHGLSGFGKFSMETAVRDVAEVIIREDVKEFAIAGMSIGAPIALEVARRFPDRVRNVVLVSPSSRSLFKRSWLWRDVLGLAESFFRMFPERKRLRMVNYGRQPQWPTLLYPLKDLQGIHARDLAGVAKKMLGVELDFRRVDVPVLILTGKNDSLIRKEVIDSIVDSYPMVTHVQLPEDHLLLTGNPQGTAEAMRRFLEA